jgi:hypothetical protein
MSDLDFRLSKSVRPVRYDLGIEVDLDAWTFRGSETIELKIAAPAATVTLHATELDIADVHAVLADGARIKASSASNPIAETVSFHFERPLPAGTSRLNLEFRGTILARLRGFYRSQKDGARYAATQFEAADARRAFSCFDEPEFKARFALWLIVPSHLTAIANGAVEEERELGNAAGKYASPDAADLVISRRVYRRTVRGDAGRLHARPAPVRVFLPRGMAAKGIYARDAHVRSLTTSRSTRRSPIRMARSTRSAYPTSKPARWRTPAPSRIGSPPSQPIPSAPRLRH